MILICAPALMPTVSVHCKAQEKSETLYRIRVKDKYGFIDRSGKVIVPATLADAAEFSEGLACVRKLTRFGFIDTTGRFAIEPTYFRADPFADGLALVLVFGRTSNKGTWCYIDKTGKAVIKLQDRTYPSFAPESFAEGRAVFYEGQKCGYLDKTGKTVIEPQFDRCFAFAEGLAKIRIGELYGFIDKSGKTAIALQFPRPYTPDILGRPHGSDHDLCFHDGLASVEIGPTRKWAFIDQTGAVVFAVPNNQYSPFSFSEGLVRMRNDQGDEGFLDSHGKIAITPIWLSVTAFSEGLAAVEKRSNYQGGCEHNNCWGYLDRAGRVIIEPQFSTAGPFRGGLAWVVRSIPRRNYSDAYQQGYIDTSGHFVWSTIIKD